MLLNFDVIIIGSGPAGMTSAIYLKRSNFNVVMIDSNAPGGQLNRITTVENYPGFSKIAGPDLAYNIFQQTQTLGVPYKYGEVIDITDMGDYKVVKTAKETLTCKAVIIATGRKPIELGLPDEKKLIGRGISWCAICDGALFKDKDVAVVGSGNNALKESLYLSDIANKVTIINPLSDFKGDDKLIEKISSNPKIDVYLQYEVVELNTDGRHLDGVVIKAEDERETKLIDTTGLFIYMGTEPATNFTNQLKLETNNSYIVVNSNMMSNVDGIFACGDVIDKELYQITTSVAEGSKAAMGAIKFIGE